MQVKDIYKPSLFFFQKFARRRTESVMAHTHSYVKTSWAGARNNGNYVPSLTMVEKKKVPFYLKDCDGAIAVQVV